MNKPIVRLFWIISIFTVFHIVTAATLGLGDDEAYYWQWSKHLALSYFDHPPLIAYIIYVTTYLFGDNPFGVRFFNVLMLPILSILVYKITVYIYGSSNKGNLAVLILNILPIYFLGSLMIVPDTPMLFCYVLGLYLFIQIVHENKKSYWYYMGIVTGIGLLSKYMMLFIYLAVFLYLIIDYKQRYWLKSFYPYIAFVLSITIFSPVIYWNSQHQWLSFIYQFYDRHNHSLHIDVITFLTFLGAQLLLVSPIFFVAFLVIVFKNYTKNINRLLLCFGLPPLLIFTSIGLVTSVQPSWALLSYIPLLIVFVGNASGYHKTKLWAIVTTLLLCLLVIVQTYYPILRIQPLKDDNTSDFYGWDLVAQDVRQFMQTYNQSGRWFLFAPNYQLTSQMAFALDNKYTVYSLADHHEEYQFWQDEAQLLGKDGLLILSNFYPLKPAKHYKCGHWQLYKTVNVVRANLVFRQIYLYQCFNYQGQIK